MEASDLIEQNFEKTVLKNKIDSMKEEMSLFSRTLDSDHLDNAKSMWKELDEENHTQPDLQITSKELFEAGFQFQSVAAYENVQAQLTELQNAQDNLN
mmetsp:Transcript_9295/g.15656  ORF Transcript_9295/g.15656 Transcript_9295/m.15656 type:complete len:98 (+) Transcript_9295:229-522(+)